jgi:hypothetical protein
MAERAFPAPVGSRIWTRLAGMSIRLLTLRPFYILTALAVVQWLLLVALIASIHHNGWLFYQGGDETFYYTAGWGISRGHLPQTSIGYGWTLLMAPIALFAGPSYLVGLPAVVLLQVLVLLPLGLVFAYGIGERIAGRWLGTVVAVGWVVAPYLVIPGFQHSYHEKWVEQFLPQALGLTGLSDFFAMVVTMGAAWLFLRALDTRGTGDAVLAGLLTGLSIGIKPADVLFLAGPALAFLVARHRETVLVYAAAIVPAALTLAVWKERGLGHLPILGVTIGYGSARAASVALPLAVNLPGSLNFDWHQLGINMAQIRESFWSMRLVELLPFAGFASVARISWSKALFLGGWLGAFILVKGTSQRAAVQDGTFWRLLMPAWPAYLVLACALPLLFPGLGRAAKTRLERVVPIPVRGRTVIASAALAGALPLIVLATLPTLRDRSIVSEFTNNVIVPIAGDFKLHARSMRGTVRLSWHRPSGARGKIFYRVYRSRIGGQPAIGGVVDYVDGIACVPPSRAAAACRLLMDPVSVTTSTTMVDRTPPQIWSYRVGMMANWLDDPSRGDVLMISAPVRARIPG